MADLTRWDRDPLVVPGIATLAVDPCALASQECSAGQGSEAAEGQVKHLGTLSCSSSRS